MPQASRSVVVNVPVEQFRRVIDDFESYPSFLPEVKSIAVGNRSADWADVTYEIDVIRRIQYTLRIVSTPDGARWSLLKGDFFKKNEGSWVLRPEGEGATHATYSLEVAVGGFLPIPKAITDKLTEHQLPTLLENFKRRAESLAGAK
jgi:ribosome-associated toxin RatA of RatAB toxin-antitoxin module